MTAKVVCVGESSVGKTSLVQRYISDSYHEQGQYPTVAADFKTKTVTITPEGKTEKELIRLQLWDTVG